MKKPTRWALLGLALVLILALGAMLLGRKSTDHPVARITLDGELVEEIDLEALEGERTLTVTGRSGLSNTIVAQPGSIRVDHADCPDQICVNQGAISDGTVPIVCLPNKLIIEIVGGGDGLDAANG